MRACKCVDMFQGLFLRPNEDTVSWLERFVIIGKYLNDTGKKKRNMFVVVVVVEVELLLRDNSLLLLYATLLTNPSKQNWIVL